MKDPDKIRSFIALEITDPDVKRNISNVQQLFHGIEGKMKFVEIENMHLTLKFLGDVTEESAREIYHALQELDTIPQGGFDVEVSHVGTFETKRPRVLWIGISDHAGIIKKTYQAIEAKLETLGFPREKKKFKSHVTIARIKYLKERDDFMKIVNSHEEDVLGTQHFSEVLLKKSVLTPRGPIYSTLRYDE